MDSKKTEVKDKEKKSKSSDKDKKKKSKSGSKDREKAVKQMQKEFDSWLEEADETANIEWKKTDSAEGRVFFRFGDAEYFSLTFPDGYSGKATAGWYFYTEADALTPKWMDVLNEYCEKDRTMSQVLSHAAEQYFEVVAHDDDDDEDGDDGFDDFAGSEEEVAKPKTNPGPTLDKEKYLDIGSPAATLRLLRDLKEIKDAKADLLGFEAEPVTDSRSGKQNLYHWEIRLSGFDGDLASDMKAYAKESGKEHVTLEMRFSADYPFTPPFVRVVRPRFKFQTGHVTIGGSICMELLTRTGWQSTNSIESVLIQIRAEMTCGGARLDSSYRGDYSEHEAWDAFYRAAKNHGWDSKGLGADMFPKIY